MSVTKMYSVLDKWTDLEKENIVDFTSVDGTVTQARLNGVPVGGGSDFTKATVTFNTMDGYVLIPFANDDDSVMDNVALETGPYNAVLYKGKCRAQIDEESYSAYKIAVVSGNASVVVPDKVVEITGDCVLNCLNV